MRGSTTAPSPMSTKVSENVEVLYDQLKRLPAQDEGTEIAKLRREMDRRTLGNGYAPYQWNWTATSSLEFVIALLPTAGSGFCPWPAHSSTLRLDVMKLARRRRSTIERESARSFMLAKPKHPHLVARARVADPPAAFSVPVCE
jgi:hypothetical protein